MGRRNRKLIRYVLIPLCVGLAVIGAGLVLLVGPWPVYSSSGYRDQAYFAGNLARIDEALAESRRSPAPGRLLAGWAERDMTPAVGTPLGGYSDRPNDKRCVGIHDRVYARAIVLNDGEDTVALVGTDLQMLSMNLAQRVWGALSGKTPLTQNDILFTASHTHCGPGGFAPGLLADYSTGAYDAEVEAHLSESIAGAILDAYAALSPAALAHASLEVPEYIENRTNVDGVDPWLRFLVLQNEAGGRCYAVRYSAHPTILPEAFLEMSAEYPGAMCRDIAAKTGAFAVYLGGANGAMGPVPPEAPSDVERMERMGAALAERVLAHAEAMSFSDRMDIVSLGVRVEMPPMQVRPFSAQWRFSPYLADVVGLPREGWIQAVRVGDLVFVGMPHDAGGVIARDWAAAAAEDGVTLWVSSHCVAYCGYLTPDEYYVQDPLGYDQWYEWRLMNWYGPEQAAFWTDLKAHILRGMA